MAPLITTSGDSAYQHERKPLVYNRQQQAVYVDYGDNNESHVRRRFCVGLIFAVCVFVAAAAAGIVLSHRRQEHESADLAAEVADRALEDLNSNRSEQSDRISKRCESTVLLFRHCEKFGPRTTDDNNNEHCSYAGFQRAQFLPTLFGSASSSSSTTTAAGRWPKPSKIYTLGEGRPDGHLNFREFETVLPLSNQTGIPVETADHPDLAKRYFDLLRTGEMCGKVTVVSWRHEYLPELARALGCGPQHGCPEKYPRDQFDQVWQLKYVFHPPTLGESQEGEDELLPAGGAGDSRRRLRSGRSRKGWNVFGSVQQQNFDPLAFSYQVGDYPEGGTDKGGRWRSDEV